MRNLIVLVFVVPVLGLVLVTCGGRAEPPVERLDLQKQRLELETKMLDLAFKRFEFESKRFESMAERHPNARGRVGSRGRPIDVIAKFNEIISLNPNDPMAYAQRSRAYRRLGMPQRALEDLDEAISVNPQFGAAYVGRARLRTVLGMDAEAHEDVARAEDLGFDTTRLKTAMDKLKRIR